MKKRKLLKLFQLDDDTDNFLSAKDMVNEENNEHTT